MSHLTKLECVVFLSFFTTFKREAKKTKKRHENTQKLTNFHRFYQDLKTFETSPKCAYSDGHSNTEFFKKWQIYTSVVCVFSYIIAKTPLVWSPKNRVHFYTGTGPYRNFLRNTFFLAKNWLLKPKKL